VNPGVIDTPFREAFSESMKNFAENDSYWSGGKAIECANVIVFLASDAASYVVGDSIEVNGGQLMLYLLSPALDGTNHMTICRGLSLKPVRNRLSISMPGWPSRVFVPQCCGTKNSWF
jgi:hypothetical protein